MPDPDIDAQVRRILATELSCPLDQIRPDSQLTALPGLDSLKLLKVVAAVETQYDVGLDDELLYDLKTVSDVTALVQSELSYLASLTAGSQP